MGRVLLDERASDRAAIRCFGRHRGREGDGHFFAGLARRPLRRAVRRAVSADRVVRTSRRSAGFVAALLAFE